MKVKAANGFARILKAEGIPWVSCYPTNHVNNALGEEGVHFLGKCDVLFSIGSSLFPNRFSHAVPDADKKTIVQCTVDTLDINRSYETRHAVIGDAKLTLAALAGELSARAGGPRKRPEVVEEIRKGKQEVLAK